MRPNKWTAIIIIVVVGAVVVWYFLGNPLNNDYLQNAGPQVGNQTQWGSSKQLQNWMASTTNQTNTNNTLNNLPASLFTQTHHNDKFNFSFRYPEGFKVGEFKQTEDTTIIVVQHPQRQIGVQVAITPLEKQITLTKDFIEQELPDYPVKNPQPVRFNGKKKGLVFKSSNDAFDQSREIWFTYRQTLYQITSYQSLDPFVKTFFKTWEFE